MNAFPSVLSTVIACGVLLAGHEASAQSHPAPVRIHTDLLRGGNGKAYKSYSSPGKGAFTVRVRLYAGSDASLAPIHEELISVNVASTEPGAPASGVVNEPIKLKGSTDLLIGAQSSTPLPTADADGDGVWDLYQNEVWFTTEVLTTSKSGVVKEEGETPREQLGALLPIDDTGMYVGPTVSGAEGPAGEAGPAGEIGPQGEPGPAGPEGAPGASGPQGDAGPAGPAGPSGAAGPAFDGGIVGHTIVAPGFSTANSSGAVLGGTLHALVAVLSDGGVTAAGDVRTLATSSVIVGTPLMDIGTSSVTAQGSLRSDTSVVSRNGYIGSLKAGQAIVAGTLGNGDVFASASLHAADDVIAGGTITGLVKNFVEPDPRDPDGVIVYSCAEGPEATTFLRGRGQLVGGHAILVLPEHFGLVTGEDDLTVQLTPMGLCNGLAAVSLSTRELHVTELLNGHSDVAFSYLIQGRRARFPTWEAERKRATLADDGASLDLRVEGHGMEEADAAAEAEAVAWALAHP